MTSSPNWITDSPFRPCGRDYRTPRRPASRDALREAGRHTWGKFKRRFWGESLRRSHKRLRESFGIREACIVADRGMISADTIAALEAEKIEYILGVRERTSREVRAEIIEDDGLAVPLLIPRQKGETELAVRETTIAGRRYVICRNAEEAKKDAAARTELIASLERKLAQGDKALVANKGFRRFLKTPEGNGFIIDRAKVETVSRSTAAGSNGSASSTISPISAKSTSNRMAAGPDCAPLPARPSTRCAAPSASPCRPSSRRCRPPPEPRLWCLKRRMARKPLIINVVQIETAEVGLDQPRIGF